MMGLDVNGYDNQPEWGYCHKEGCKEEAFPIWKSGDYPDDPDLLLCPKHIGLLIGDRDAKLRRAEADAGWLRGLVQRAITHLDSYGEISTPIAAMAEDLEVLLAKTGDAGAALPAELEAARAVVALARDDRTTGAQLALALANYDQAVKVSGK